MTSGKPIQPAEGLLNTAGHKRFTRAYNRFMRKRRPKLKSRRDRDRDLEAEREGKKRYFGVPFESYKKKR